MNSNNVLIGIIIIVLLGFMFYSALNERWERDSLITSDNWNCTDDCSGHEAGYAWGEKKGISHPDDCTGNSKSFIEGCKAFVNENWLEERKDFLRETK